MSNRDCPYTGVCKEGCGSKCKRVFMELEDDRFETVSVGGNPIKVDTRPFTFTEGTPVDPLDKQEGGNHYKDMAIQPIEYITKNKLDFCEGNVVKYISRHRQKNGAEDLRKVIHYAELLLREYSYD